MPARSEETAESTTLTVRLPAKRKDQLGELARRTRRSKSFLAADAIADYLARELAIVETIERGRADVRAGRHHAHEQVMDEARRIIDEADRAEG